MLNAPNIWIRLLWVVASLASGAVHPLLFFFMLVVGVSVFARYLEAALLLLVWFMAYGIVDRWRLLAALLCCVALVYAIEWSKTRLIVY